MASLYLGKIGGKNKLYEIHALTKELPFREYRASEIADTDLFQRLIEGRYRLLESGRAIYCTAVHPDKKNKIEINPHDSREGTVHIVAIDDKGDIECAVSVAVDIGNKDNGTAIGLPLENSWKRNGYPEGVSLDAFRAKYLPSIYGTNRKIRSWEMAELYRHYKRSCKSDITPRLGVYTGCFHLLAREPLKKGKQPTWLWIFDTIPQYFNLYKLAGIAVLRDLTISQKPSLVSPGKQDLTIKRVDGLKSIFYQGKKISRHVRTPIPYKENGILDFSLKEIPFLDGVVDVNKVEEVIINNPIFPRLKNRRGFSWDDRKKMRMGLGIAAKRIFDEDAKSFIGNAINKWALKKTRLVSWEFNQVGSLKNHGQEILQKTFWQRR